MLKISNETKVALLAIAAIAVGIWGFKFLKGQNMLTFSKDFYVRYDNVQDLRVSAPVFIRGLQVGSVKKVSIDPKDGQSIIVVLNVEGGFDVPKDAMAVITSPSFMGGRAIELEYDRVCTNDCAQSGDFLQGTSRSFLEGMITPAELDVYTDRLRKGLTINIDSLAKANPESFAGTLEALDNSLKNIEALTYRLDRLMAASERGLTATINNTAALTGSLATNKDQISSIMRNLDTLSLQLKDAGFDQSAHKATTTLDTLTQRLSDLRRTLATTERTLSSVDTLAQNLLHGKGTANKLLTDEVLAEDLERTLRHTQLLIQDLRLNPKRYTTVKLKVFGKNKTKGYETPFNDPIYTMEADSLERLFSKRLRENQPDN
ncbi:MAG: MCE family protein [Saprospiraceae bacterium]|nr:MCE family protein [Saprospiraceae bacterium]